MQVCTVSVNSDLFFSMAVLKSANCLWLDVAGEKTEHAQKQRDPLY